MIEDRIEADHGTCWAAILAGGFVMAAVTLLVLAFGVGVGFSVVSPWSDSGVSGSTAIFAGGLFLVVVAMIGATIGGYVTGRLRHSWGAVHADERFFRDMANGFAAWAFATVMGAAVLGGATTHILAGASAGSIPAAAAGAAQAGSSGPADIYVDKMLRTNAAPQAAGAAAAAGNQNAARGELTRILAPAMRKGGDVSADDRAYAAKVISARTGIPQAEAEQRVNQTITDAKNAADAARRAAAKLSLWLAASMLAGALSAGLAAAEGGKLRNSRWYDGVDHVRTTTTTVRS
jgi:hypothetical protein